MSVSHKLGLGVVNLTRRLARKLEITDASSTVVVAEVLPGSLAEAANLHAGDLLLSIDDREVRSAAEAASCIRDARRRGATEVDLIIECARETRRLPLRFQPLV
ncbi:MAG: PDZ domain-containing protein [Armatimonas sp.]